MYNNNVISISTRTTLNLKKKMKLKCSPLEKNLNVYERISFEYTNGKKNQHQWQKLRDFSRSQRIKNTPSDFFALLITFDARIM